MAAAEYELFDPRVAHDEIDEDPPGGGPLRGALAAFSCGSHEAFEAISVACFAEGLEETGRRMHATAVNSKRQLYEGPPLVVYAVYAVHCEACPASGVVAHASELTFDLARAEAGVHGFDELSAADFYTDSLAEIAFDDLKRQRAAACT
jgi:hypothetical protein